MEQEAKLTKGPVGRNLLNLAAPMTAGIFAITAFNLADTYFVARLGTRELAAMSFTFPVVMLVHSIALGLGLGTASVVSRAIGEGDSKKVRRLATHSLMLAVLAVVLVATVGLATIRPLFTALGAGPDILPLIRQYMTIWYVGTVFVTIPMVGNNIIRATGDTKWPSMIMIFAAGINIALDPLLIFGLAGLPRLELAGAALATVIGRASTLVLSLSILHFREKLIDFSSAGAKAMWNSCKRILYIAAPSTGANLLIPVVMGVVVRLAAGYGTAAVAAVGAGVRVDSLAMLPIMALGASIVPFIGQNWGAGNLDRVHKAQNVSAGFSISWGLLGVVALALTAGPIARLFSAEPEVIRNIAMYLWIVPVGYGMQGVGRLAIASFNASNRPLYAVALALANMFVFCIPLAYGGSMIFGLKGLFGGMALANIVGGALAIFVVVRARRRDAVLVGEK
jgi:putative MATE family efflux protein